MKVGFTTSLPIEVVIAAGHQPIDLNNIFITGDAAGMVSQAELNGFPRNICAWIKGIYSAILRQPIDLLIGVLEGDCSNTRSLLSILKDINVNVIPFSFPPDRSGKSLNNEIVKLEEYFGVNRSQVQEVKIRLDKIRNKLVLLDQLTWAENKITGLENHSWLVSSSDFNGDPEKYADELDLFLTSAGQREKINYDFRIAYLGVPPIITDLYQFLADQEIHIVFNEIQRQFSMPYLEKDIVDQYLRYTYPYAIEERLADIRIELKKRNVDAVISYSQSFCHRQLDNLILKKYLDLPFLILEGDKPGELDARTRLRIESFLDMLRY